VPLICGADVFVFIRPFLLPLITAVVLVSCTASKQLDYAPVAPKGADVQRVLIATNRQESTPDQGFGPQRSKSLAFADYQVSVPPNHQAGKIEWPNKHRKVNPEQDFVTVGATQLANTAAFRADLNARAARLPKGSRDAVVFVHGYDSNFAEGLYRIAQLSHDLDVSGIRILFSWPSAGTKTGYAYDRDSATFSRDALQQLLETLARSNVEHVLLVAHSMGAMVSVEALRQMYIQGRPAIARKLRGVILMSPDIDVDVFKSQLRRIKPLPKPFVIFSSTQDFALRVSALLAGEKQRLGSLQSDNELAKTGVFVIDISNFSTDGDWLHHSSFATSPTLLAVLRSLPKLDKQLAPQTNAARNRRSGVRTLARDGYWLVPAP